MIRPWLKFFRVVNLPTVPGDVFVGAAAFVASVANCRRTVPYDVGAGLRPVAFAALASVFMYMFGLADNDIVGAGKDSDRPIPVGEISLGAARIARGLCLFAVMIIGAAANLPSVWWIVSAALAFCCVVYNRTKLGLVMGFCRGLDVLSGVAALVATTEFRNDVPVGTMEDAFVSMFFWVPAVVLAVLYIASVTWYSKGEELDPAKKRRVGVLVGSVIYLQLLALLAAYCVTPRLLTRDLLIAGAVMLVLLRLLKRIFPKVSAS